MGKIKSKSIRKAAKILTNNGVKFSGNFNKNKQILEGLNIGKKIRNQLAGLTAKNKKEEMDSIK